MHSIIEMITWITLCFLIGWFVGHENNQLNLDWPTRLKICIGIARGLAFLHEESKLKIAHRDIKATNVLLDGNLNPKISDFGLARLDEEEKSHISARVAGTMLVTTCINKSCDFWFYFSMLNYKCSSSWHAEDIWHQNMHYGVTWLTKQMLTVLGLLLWKLLVGRTTITTCQATAVVFVS